MTTIQRKGHPGKHLIPPLFLVVPPICTVGLMGDVTISAKIASVGLQVIKMKQPSPIVLADQTLIALMQLLSLDGVS